MKKAGQMTGLFVFMAIFFFLVGSLLTLKVVSRPKKEPSKESNE